MPVSFGVSETWKELEIAFCFCTWICGIQSVSEWLVNTQRDDWWLWWCQMMMMRSPFSTFLLRLKVLKMPFQNFLKDITLKISALQVKPYNDLTCDNTASPVISDGAAQFFLPMSQHPTLKRQQIKISRSSQNEKVSSSKLISIGLI